MSGNVRLSKTVLLVDDLDILRKMIRDFLKSLGIEVLEVSNATEAIHTARSHTGTIDLLLTDVEMPGMSGWDLAPEIAGLKPGIRILYMSAAVSKGTTTSKNRNKPGCPKTSKWKPEQLQERDLKGVIAGRSLRGAARVISCRALLRRGMKCKGCSR